MSRSNRITNTNDTNERILFNTYSSRSHDIEIIFVIKIHEIHVRVDKTSFLYGNVAELESV